MEVPCGSRDYCNNCHPGSKSLSMVTRYLSRAKKRGGFPRSENPSDDWVLSALSSDHGFVGLSSSGASHATSTICAYAGHISFYTLDAEDPGSPRAQR